MNEKEEEKLVNWFEKNFIDSDKFDIFAEMDRKLTLDENKNILQERYADYFIGKQKAEYNDAKEKQLKEKFSRLSNPYELNWGELQ